MNESRIFNRIWSIAASRVALNLYFWSFLLITKSQDYSSLTTFSQGFYTVMMLFFASFFMILAYFNNLVLLPALWFKGRKFLYSVIAIAFTWICAMVYVWMMKYTPVRFPGLEVMDLSMVMSPLTSDLSFAGVWNDLQTYFIVMLVWVLVHTLIGTYRNNQKQFRIMKAAVEKHRETELAFLKSQMNPHFLFNTLNNLYGLSLRGSAETPHYILKLSSVLRYVLYDADAALVSFQKEKEVIQAYTDIELLRLGEMKDAHFSISADRDYSIPPLLWLPLLENAFKYTRGLEASGINFMFRILNHELTLTCENRKPKSNLASEKGPGGIGLANLSTRLKLLYPDQQPVTIEDGEEWFRIALHIKLNQK